MQDVRIKQIHLMFRFFLESSFAAARLENPMPEYLCACLVSGDVKRYIVHMSQAKRLGRFNPQAIGTSTCHATEVTHRLTTNACVKMCVQLFPRKRVEICREGVQMIMVRTEVEWAKKKRVFVHTSPEVHS